MQKHHWALQSWIRMELVAHYVDQNSQLAPLIEHLSTQPVVGFDTEFISEGRYEHALCLIQLSTPEGIWIVDPQAVHDLGGLWQVLATRELVTVAARQEIKFCEKGAGTPPSSILDLQ